MEQEYLFAYDFAIDRLVLLNQVITSLADLLERTMFWLTMNTVFNLTIYLTLSWPDFPTDMHDCAKNVYIKLTI